MDGGRGVDMDMDFRVRIASGKRERGEGWDKESIY